jgi:D-tyrosyl-tRNA(Tyr) deacylase
MRAVVQRVRQASVDVDGQEVSRIGKGLCCLVGVEKGDSSKDTEYIAEKIAGLRIFDDESGRMNLDVIQTGGEVLLVSQFTLLGDARKGRRPSYTLSGDPETARDIFDALVEVMQSKLPGKVRAGIFQAMMDVSLINHGPVTILLDSRKIF